MLFSKSLFGWQSTKLILSQTVHITQLQVWKVIYLKCTWSNNTNKSLFVRGSIQSVKWFQLSFPHRKLSIESINLQTGSKSLPTPIDGESKINDKDWLFEEDSKSTYSIFKIAVQTRSILKFCNEFSTTWIDIACYSKLVSTIKWVHKSLLQVTYVIHQKITATPSTQTTMQDVQLLFTELEINVIFMGTSS